MMEENRTISACRICGSSDLTEILDLGIQSLTGIFPKNLSDSVPKSPLILVKCEGKESCGLVQLKHTYSTSEMYGNNYGYRSGLNKSMVNHLKNKIKYISEIVELHAGDFVVDIGSNDGTTLGFYPDDINRIGIDPVSAKFKKYYKPGIKIIEDFFSARVLAGELGKSKARVITSFSMFYDLENPLLFMKEIHDSLDKNGIWVLEQSYLPAMLKQNSFDTVCHEHLEYYSLTQLQWMVQRTGLRIIDVDFNEVNGGSFSVIIAKDESTLDSDTNKIKTVLGSEKSLSNLSTFVEFAGRVKGLGEKLCTKLYDLKQAGNEVYGLGASTKGNVLLQYFEIGPDLVSAIGEVNEDKFGCYTPGTLIPIRPESELLLKPNGYFLVLPWHFRENFINNKAYKGKTLIFPLPELSIQHI